MSENRRPTLLWPLLLIVVGVLLLLNQLGAWRVSWWDLLRVWPLILIMIGLDILLARTRWGRWVTLLVVGVTAVALVMVASGVGPARRALERETWSYPTQGARSATVRLEAGVGRLTVSALEETANLLEAQWDYDPAWTRLTHDVQTEGSEARVHLKATQTRRGPLMDRSFAEAWFIQLNPDLPLRLDVNAGVSQSELDLRRLTLTRLNLNAGVGNVRLLLPERGGYEAVLNAGVGALTIEIPSTLEARIHIDGGLGTVHVDRRYVRDGRYYTTPGYAAAQQRVNLDIDGGIGTLTVR